MLHTQLFTESRKDSPWISQLPGYACALLFPLGVILLHKSFPEFLGTRHVLIYPALYLVAWLFGPRPGFCSLAIYVFLLPLVFTPETWVGWFRISLFALSSAFVLWVIGRMKFTEGRLVANHGLFKTSLESIGDAVIVTDRELRIMFMNPVAEELTGREFAEVYRKPLLSVLLLEGDSVGNFLHALTDVKEGKRSWESKGHCRLIRHDKDTRYVETSCAPIHIRNQSMGLVIALKDVGKVQKAMASLTQSEERLRLATDVSELGIWEVNLLTGHVARNENHDRIFGYPQMRFFWSIRDYGEHLHPEDRQGVLTVVRTAIRSCDSFAHTFRILREDDEARWVSITGKVECDHRQNPIRIIGTVMDITEKKESEDMLHEALFYRDEFLSIASHELKTPLTSLKLQSQMFKRHLERKTGEAYSPERIKRFMLEADNQVTRLTRLVDDMLDISRIRTGRLSISTEEVEISSVIKEVIERMRPSFPKLEIGDFDSGVIRCDRLRIEQVMTNILNNALRYGKGLPVRVDLRSVGGSVKISVTDQGIGIPTDQKEKIFTRFQRAVPANEISGLGLGLYISRQIVEAHRGKIWVDSELEKGSCFTVEIPRDEVSLQ